MKTDRELLELAAKAIGVKAVCGRACGGIEGRLRHPMGAGLLCMNDLYWNPFADDGDALRLAVKLGLQLDMRDPETRAFGAPTGRIDVHHRTDPYAATRRAIVGAAAAIGEAMP